MNNCNMILVFRVFCFISSMLTLDIQWCANQGAVSQISDIEGVPADPGKTKKQPLTQFEFFYKNIIALFQGLESMVTT